MFLMFATEFRSEITKQNVTCHRVIEMRRDVPFPLISFHLYFFVIHALLIFI